MGGRRYSIGTLAPGKHFRVFAHLLAESHLNVEFRDPQNQQHVETVIGYAESAGGYCARGEAIIGPTGKVETRRYTTPGGCWSSWLEFIRCMLDFDHLMIVAARVDGVIQILQ